MSQSISDSAFIIDELRRFIIWRTESNHGEYEYDGVLSSIGQLQQQDECVRRGEILDHDGPEKFFEGILQNQPQWVRNLLSFNLEDFKAIPPPGEEIEKGVLGYPAVLVGGDRFERGYGEVLNDIAYFDLPMAVNLLVDSEWDPRTLICPICRGKGKMRTRVRCEACHGSPVPGNVLDRDNSNYHFSASSYANLDCYVTCEKCHGTRAVHHDTRRAKTECCLLAYSGIRLESLGNDNATDGITLGDLPELDLSTLEFSSIPVRHRTKQVAN